MRRKIITYLLISLCLPSSASTGEKLVIQDRTIETNEKKYRIFSKGTEFYFLYIEEFQDDTWAYTYVLNKKFAGEYAWIPAIKERAKFRFYATDKEQSFQTLQLKQATYIRNSDNIAGYLNSNYKKQPDYKEIKQHRSKYSDTYPATNLVKNEHEALKQYEIKACPNHPKRLKSEFCSPVPRIYKLPKHLIQAVHRVAKKFKIESALLAAIIHKESEFNPFSENEYEKKICAKQKEKGERCTDYLWGQGLAQIGANNAKKYGMLWKHLMPRIKTCDRKKHIFKRKCFYSLERTCRAKYKKHKLWPTYCPTASIRAIAKNIQDIKNRQHQIFVKIKNTNKNKIINLTKHMQRNKAEEFRYTIGIYNRGMKPVNSIEEYYRQYGIAPSWYGHAWKAQRIVEETPSIEMGFLLLHNEVINRCHVWQLAGLCGKSLKGTLIDGYSRYLQRYNQTFVNKKSFRNP